MTTVNSTQSYAAGPWLVNSPPTGQRSRGKLSVHCLDVAESDIIENIQLVQI